MAYANQSLQLLAAANTLLQVYKNRLLGTFVGLTLTKQIKMASFI